MMKYDELVKRLLSHAKLDREYNGSGKLFEDAADAIEKLLGVIQRQREMINATAYLPLFQKPMKWISVTERLPEQNTRVIGFMAWKGITAIEYQHGKWYSIDHLQPLPNEAVTHWMPLPEPPKGDTDG